MYFNKDILSEILLRTSQSDTEKLASIGPDFRAAVRDITHSNAFLSKRILKDFGVDVSKHKLTENELKNVEELLSDRYVLAKTIYEKLKKEQYEDVDRILNIIPLTMDQIFDLYRISMGHENDTVLMYLLNRYPKELSLNELSEKHRNIIEHIAIRNDNHKLLDALYGNSLIDIKRVILDYLRYSKPGNVNILAYLLSYKNANLVHDVELDSLIRTKLQDPERIIEILIILDSKLDYILITLGFLSWAIEHNLVSIVETLLEKDKVYYANHIERLMVLAESNPTITELLKSKL